MKFQPYLPNLVFFGRVSQNRYASLGFLPNERLQKLHYIGYDRVRDERPNQRNSRLRARAGVADDGNADAVGSVGKGFGAAGQCGVSENRGP